MPAKEQIRIREGQQRDRFNDPVGSPGPWREVMATAVVPRSAEDYEQRGPIVISGFLVVLPSSDPIQDRDEIEIRGEVHQIDGSVGDFGRKKIIYTMRAN